MKSAAYCLLLLLSSGAAFAAHADGRIVLREARLPQQVKDDIVAVTSKELTDVLFDSKQKPVDAALDFWVSFPKLTRTGQQTIEIDANELLAGATGNTQIWIFLRVGNHARLIFTGGGSGSSPASTRYHNGLLDVKTAWNMSCCNGGIEVYRFDGRRYRPAYCYGYTRTEDGDLKFGPRTHCDD
jgi:hypothetical protein